MEIKNILEQILKSTFYCMVDRYKHLLGSEFYPARGRTGFTEANQTHFFINALVKNLNDKDCIEWLEFPWSDKNTHIDGMVYSPKYEAIFYIESKRFSNFDKKLKELSNDLKRVISDNKEFLKEYGITNIAFHYVIGLADIWQGSDKHNLIGSWENNNSIFIDTLNIQNYNDTRLIKCVYDDRYYLLINYNEISKYRKIEENFWQKLELELKKKIDNVNILFKYNYDEEKRKNNANLKIELYDGSSIFIRRAENTFITVESSDTNIEKKVREYFNNEEKSWIYTNIKIDFFNFNNNFLRLENPDEQKVIIKDIVRQINDLIKIIS